MERFQKLALAALISVLFLVFVGAIVRATGSGMGCPDWPKCWGGLLPPSSVEEVDFTRLDLEKFRRKAERHGRDPASITIESLRGEFNATHAWVEYINRLCAMPVGIFSVALFIASFWQRRARPVVFGGALLSLLIVLIEAWMGAKVVYSDLKPGIITLHMALAFVILCILVFVAWRGCETPWRREWIGSHGKRVWAIGLGVFLLTVAEGVMGAQVRELTDELAKSHGSTARSDWTAKLEGSVVYLVHRSFSWLIVLGAVFFLVHARKQLNGGLGWLETAIGILVASLLVMGIVLAHVGVLPVVQVLHVGAAALLITTLFFWLLASRPNST